MAIVLDDDSTDRASSPESEIGRVGDVMDLLWSDPITDQTTPRPTLKAKAVRLPSPSKVDRKGKGRAIPVSVSASVSLPTDLVSHSTYRDLSPEIDGIESLGNDIRSDETIRKVEKRKSEDGPSGTKRIRTTSEPEVCPGVEERRQGYTAYTN